MNQKAPQNGDLLANWYFPEINQLTGSSTYCQKEVAINHCGIKLL
jgi:hypothetical protein